jgi:hypothetical protein
MDCLIPTLLFGMEIAVMKAYIPMFPDEVIALIYCSAVSDAVLLVYDTFC